MDRLKAKAAALNRRHKRVRGKISGSPDRPRLCVTRTNTHIYAQVVDDLNRVTLLSASTIDPDVKAKITGAASTVAAAKVVGETIGQRAAEKGITEVVFDRGGRLYHGRVKALADGARSAGLTF